MDLASPLPGLALLPAGLAVGLIVLSRHWPAVRETWSVLAAAAQTLIVAAMVPRVGEGARLTWEGPALVAGIPLLLRADALGLLFAALASGLWLLTTVYSIGYVRALDEPRQTRYFACFALCLFATVGLALAGNLLTFFAFFEILTVAAYPLVVHKGTEEAARAGRIYLLYTLTGGTALLGAVVGTYGLAGTVEFRPGGILPGDAAPAALWGLFTLFVIGCGVKAAIVPLHTWLPLAMIAPTPVSALLHAVAVVKAGVFGVVRVVGFVFGPERLVEIGASTALAGLALTTILLASLAAAVQDNLKRLLAFSTVSQLSYVVLGAALGTETGFAGGVMHIASHALLKITLFFCAGAIYVTAHVERLSDMGGIGRRMPLTMGAFAAAAFMLAGMPPGAGFLSKWRLIEGAVQGGAWLAVGVLLAGVVLNVAYFTPVIVRAFAEPAAPGRAEAPASMLVPLLLTAAGGLLLGLVPDGLLPVLPLAVEIARSVNGP
jgi:multicomponent Na+:H+ antiporter subunit D